MSWVHNDGHISVAGTSVPRTEAKSEVRECYTRKATPEELERYFGERPRALSKDELRERLHPKPRQTTIDDVIAAARGVDEKKYKAMKAAVIIIGKVNGWD